MASYRADRAEERARKARREMERLRGEKEAGDDELFWTDVLHVAHGVRYEKGQVRRENRAAKKREQSLREAVQAWETAEAEALSARAAAVEAAKKVMV